MDMKEAREILGVGEGATKEQIEKSYFIILKRHRTAAATSEQQKHTALEEIDRATAAYNLLMGYNIRTFAEERNIKPNPVLKKLGIDEYKLRNFFHYYKFHMLFGIITLLLIIYGVKGCVTKVEPDLSIAFIGNFRYYSSGIMENAIKESVPGIEAPTVDGAYITSEGLGTQDYSMQMKAMVLLAAGDIDVYILDEASFLAYGKEAAFESMDQLIQQYNVDSSKNQVYILKPKDEPEEHAYGIDVSDSEILNNQGVIGDKKIVAISARAPHREKALVFVRSLLNK